MSDLNKELKTIKRVPNPNGRPKGSKNKRNQEAIDIFDENNFDPIREALKKLKDVTDPELYINTCLKLAKFKYSERKAVEHTVNPKDMPTREIIQEAKALLNELSELGEEE